MRVYAQAADYGDVGDIYEVEDNMSVATRRGSGGTDMRPAILKFLEETESGGEFGVGGIIVVTDGYLGHDSIVLPEECCVPILWLSSRDYMPFKGCKFAGEFYHFDAETGLLKELLP